MRELIVTGAGPGAEDQLTAAAGRALKEADCVVAAPRHLPLAGGHGNIIPLGDFKETLGRVENELEQDRSVAVLVSGDPGIYSLLPLLKKRFPDVPLRVLPGISSLQSLCASVGEMWQDAVILSGHGRPLSAAKLLNTVERNRLTILFCGNECSPRWACNVLAGAVGGLGERIEAIIGERLSYPDERISRGRPLELPDRLTGLKQGAASSEFDTLSLMLVRNEQPWTPQAGWTSGRIKDADFERGEVPMTREEVRSVLLDRLELTANAVFWDIGAGTGSVSAAAALLCPDGEVHAIECSSDALELLERNRVKFRLHNMFIHGGRALSVMKNNALPVPTHVFIGGSGGELREILEMLSVLKAETGNAIRVVVSAVTLDTLSEAAALLSGDKWHGLEAVQLSVAASRPLGKSLLMAARNPVTLLCAN